MQPSDKFPIDSAESKDTVESVSLINEIKSRYRRCQNYWAGWLEEAREDMRFGLGEQWKAEDVEVLTAQGRPANTFNRIHAYIQLISGYVRENTSRIKVSPEGGEDAVFSEVMDKAVQMLNKWGKLDYEINYQFDDGLFTGQGWLEAVLDYDKDPIRGEIKWANLGPFTVLVDPDSKKYDINEDAAYVLKICRYTRQKLLSLYPDKKDVIMGLSVDEDLKMDLPTVHEGDKDNYGNNANKTTVIHKSDFLDEADSLNMDKRFTYVEYWRKVYKPQWRVLDRTAEDEKFQEFPTKQAADQFIQAQGGGTAFKRNMPFMKVAIYVAGVLLDDLDSPLMPAYNGYPFFRYLAEWRPNAPEAKWRCHGIVRQVKDAQREKNKARSQALHILNTQANSGWLGEKSALTATGWTELKTLGSRPGVTIQVQDGKFDKIREITPKPAAYGQVEREQQANNEFTQILGVNPDLLGIAEDTASGRAIALRIRQAVTVLVPYFENLRYTKEIIGNFLLKMLPQLFDARKLARVLGQQYMASVQSEMYPEGLSMGVLNAFLAITKEARYDVSVAEADQNKTIRYEVFNSLVELAKIYGPVIPPDMFIDYMDVPNSEELKKRILGEQAKQQQAAMAAQMGASAQPGVTPEGAPAV